MSKFDISQTALANMFREEGLKLGLDRGSDEGRHNGRHASILELGEARLGPVPTAVAEKVRQSVRLDRRANLISRGNQVRKQIDLGMRGSGRSL